MPYITQEKRKEIEPPILPLEEYVKTVKELSAGDLNYIFTVIAIAFWERKHHYQGIADISSAFDGASKEFYRRVAAGYEDEKIIQNGDVYPSK